MSNKNSVVSEKDLNKASGGKIYYNSYTKKYEVYHDETGIPSGEYDTEYEALKADASVNDRYIKSNTEKEEYRDRYNNFLNNK